MPDNMLISVYDLPNAYRSGEVIGAWLDADHLPHHIRKAARYEHDEAMAELPHPLFASAPKENWQAGNWRGKRALLWKAWAQIDPGNALKGAQVTGDCFPAGTLVRMADCSQKPIESIKIGDFIMSPTNQPRRVLDVIQKPYTGDLLTMKVHGFAGEITATPDHRFVHYPGIKAGRNIAGSHEKTDHTWKWKTIGDLEEGDRILMPWGANTDNAPYESFNGVVIDENTARLIGLYLAEGGVDSSRPHVVERVRFSFGFHERLLIEDAKSLVAKIFGEPCTEFHRKGTVTVVSCCRMRVATWFKTLIPGNVYNKRLPEVILRSCRSVKLACLRGWLDGDGHLRLNESSKEESWKYQGVSASNGLILDFHSLALSMRLRPKSVLRKQAKHQRVASTDFFLYGQEAEAVLSNSQPRRGKLSCGGGPDRDRRDVTENGIAARVKSISRKHAENETVYCLTVEEEHAFTAGHFAVSNCVSWGERCKQDTRRAVEIVLLGERETYIKRQATCLLYSGRGHTGQGASPAGIANWAVKCGILLEDTFTDANGKVWDFSNYNDYVKFGIQYGRGGMPASIISITSKNRVVSQSFVRSTDELCDLLLSGYAASIGFSLDTASSGNPVSRLSGRTAHETCIVGYDDTPEARAKCKQSLGYEDTVIFYDQSWGNWNKVTNILPEWEPWGEGMYCHSARDCQKHINEGECIVSSGGILGFVGSPIDNLLI